MDPVTPSYYKVKDRAKRVRRSKLRYCGVNGLQFIPLRNVLWKGIDNLEHICKSSEIPGKNKLQRILSLCELNKAGEICRLLEQQRIFHRSNLSIVHEFSRLVRICEQLFLQHCRGLVDLRKWDLAIRSCKLVSANCPRRCEFQHLLGKSLLEVQCFDEAAAAFSCSLSLKPNYLPSYLARGLTYHRHIHNLSLAAADFDICLSLDQTYFKSFYYMGLVMLDLKLFHSSLEAFTRSIELQSNFSAAYFHRGLVHLAHEQWELALEDFTKVIALRPCSFEGYYNCGLSLHHLKRFPEAIISYQRCLALQPNFLSALHNCADAQSQLGQIHHAIENYSRALAICSDDSIRFKLFILRGQLWKRIHEFPRAECDYNAAIEANCNDPMAYTARGWLFVQMDKGDQGLANLTLAIEKEPLNPRNWNTRGCALLHLCDYESALLDFEKAISLEPSYARALRNRAKCLYLLNHDSRALDDFSRALDAHSPTGDYESYIRRSILFKNQGHYLAALCDLERASELGRRSKRLIWEEYHDAYAYITG